MIDAALLAQHALEGIVVATSKEARARLDRVIAQHFDAFTGDLDEASRFSTVDLLHVCAGEYVPKTFDVLRGQGIDPVFPFLLPTNLLLASRIPWELKCRAGEPKALLKDIFAEQVPRELVYRPKQGFTPPIDEILRIPAAGEILDAACAADAPLDSYVDRRVLREMVARVRSGRGLSLTAYNLLWIVLFTTAWLEQTKPPAAVAKPT
jgi:asparagine synthase (glutamine-hydrolysing)